MEQEQHDPFAQLEDWGREVERKARRRQRLGGLAGALRPGRRAVVFLVVAALLAGGVVVFRWWDRTRQGLWPDAYPTASAPAGVSATSGVGDIRKGPFDGTPAATFPEGESGLVMPAAQAAGAWSEAEVTADLAKVRSALIASHLDRRMLVEHDPSDFVALLSPIERKEFPVKIQQGDYGLVAVRIAKGMTLAQEQPRVSGRTTFRAGSWGDVPSLEVITNYVFVYPFEVPTGWAGERVVVVHSEVHWFFPKDRSVTAEYRGMSIGGSSGYWSGMDCSESHNGFTAPFKGHDASAKPDPASTEPSDAYFQPDHTLDIIDECV